MINEKKDIRKAKIAGTIAALALAGSIALGSNQKTATQCGVYKGYHIDKPDGINIAVIDSSAIGADRNITDSMKIGGRYCLVHTVPLYRGSLPMAVSISRDTANYNESTQREYSPKTETASN